MLTPIMHNGMAREATIWLQGSGSNLFALTAGPHRSSKSTLAVPYGGHRR